MRNQFLILIIAMFCYRSGTSQEVIRQASCFDSTLQKQADSLKARLTQQGFKIVREATMRMESEYEMPVIVPLTEGTFYQFAFIGDMDSKLYEVRMYDFDEKQVIYEKHYGNGMESNVISYAYVPKHTQYHMIKPVQVSKNRKMKNLCGYIIMFKRIK